MSEDNDEIESVITTSGTISNEQSGEEDMELHDFSFQVEYEAVSDFKLDGEVPENLEIDPDTGLITGQYNEMDEYVDEFEPPEDEEIKQDGSHYAQWGSAKEGSKTFNFDIVGKDTLGDEIKSSVELTVLNNYSSDRDKLIRDLEQFGELDFDGDRKFFELDGEFVTSEEYLDHYYEEGLFHAKR